MATNPRKTKSDATEALKQLTYLAAALKAPRITESPPGWLITRVMRLDS